MFRVTFTLEFSATFIVFKGKSKTIDQPQQEQPPTASKEPQQPLQTQGVVEAASAATSTLASSTTFAVASTTASTASASASDLSSNKASGALADILDLDFGAVQNNEVNELNRQYILSNAETLRQPLRAQQQIESPTKSHSSTASSNGSRRNSSLRKQPQQPQVQSEVAGVQPQHSGGHQEKSALPASADSLNQAVLRDTKIEIAGKN